MWRTDGEAAVADAALLADPWPERPGHPRSPPRRRPQQLLGAIADGLGLPRTQVRPAYEDPLSRLAAAVRQPAGRAGRRRRRPRGRQRRRARRSCWRASTTPVTEPAAYVLPLHRRDDDAGWASADWRLRRGRIVLLDGDSPAGLRLPLDSISWTPPPRRPSTPIRLAAPRARCEPPEPTTPTPSVADAEGAPDHRRWCAEIRDGLLYVFLPPTEELEHFVDLVSRLEAAAAAIGCPVVIEGYGPPADPRLQSMSDHPRPRRHRGQRRALGQLRRAA